MRKQVEQKSCKIFQNPYKYCSKPVRVMPNTRTGLEQYLYGFLESTINGVGGPIKVLGIDSVNGCYWMKE